MQRRGGRGVLGSRAGDRDRGPRRDGQDPARRRGARRSPPRQASRCSWRAARISSRSSPTASCASSSSRYLASLPLDEREELMAGTAGLADRLFGDEELTGAASGDVSFAVLHGLYWLAANLAARQSDGNRDRRPALDGRAHAALAHLPRTPARGAAAARRARPAPARAERRERAADRADRRPLGAGDQADRVERHLGRLAGPGRVQGRARGAVRRRVPRRHRRQPAVPAGDPRRDPRRGLLADGPRTPGGCARSARRR